MTPGSPRHIAQIGAPSTDAALTSHLAPNGGSRSYARSRLVTLGERLPGRFPVQCKIQKRSYDPGTVTIDRNDAHCPP